MSLKNTKENFSEWYNEVVGRAQIVDIRSPIKGCNVLLPNGFKIWEQIKKHLNNMFEKTGHENYYFPLFIPQNLLEKEAEHFEGFIPEVLWATRVGDRELGQKLALRPTSETIMYYMFALWIRSHKDLPLKVSNWANMIRWDTKRTKPLLRDREFLWNEGHTCHSTAEEGLKQVEESMEIYQKLFDNMCLSYMVLKRPPHDTFPGADYSIAYDAPLPDGRTVQIGTTHNLGQNFAKMFDIKFESKEGKNQHVYQTCYGISTRLVAEVLGLHGDDKGLVIPPSIAPYQIVLIPIFRKDSIDTVISEAKKIHEILIKAGFRVFFDDRDGYTPGWKFNEHEMRGVPIRMEIGKRDIENEGVTAVRRDTKAKSFIKNTELVTETEKLIKAINKNLKTNANKLLKESISSIDDFEELKANFVGDDAKRGFVRTNWCGNEECADSIKESCRAEVRGTRVDKKEKPTGNCIVCGKKAKQLVYIAVSY